MTCSSILGITLDVFSSPKSVRNYSSHQNRWGETCYIVVTNKMFFSVIKSVLKSSLNSVQSYRNKKSGSKMSLNSVKKNVIHREGRRSVHWIRWQKRKFTEFSDEFFTGGSRAHICSIDSGSHTRMTFKVDEDNCRELHSSYGYSVDCSAQSSNDLTVHRSQYFFYIALR